MAEDLVYIEGDGDGSIEIVDTKVNCDLLSLESVGEKDGDPYEHRRDIIETKELLVNVRKKLNFKDEEKIKEELEQLKPRKNFDSLFDAEFAKLAELGKSAKIESKTLLVAAEKALEQCVFVKEVANKGEATLKRPHEILESIIPIFAETWRISSTRPELSNDTMKALNEYERSKMLMKRCQLEFDMEGREKSKKESALHLENALAAAKLDCDKLHTRLEEEEELGWLKEIQKSKEEVQLLIGNESRDLVDKLKSCKTDIEEINSCISKQEERMTDATKVFEGRLKSTNVKLTVNRNRQEELKKQLAALESEEEKILNNIVFDKEVQDRAEQWNSRVQTSLGDMKKDIKSIESKATAMQDVIGAVHVFSELLLDAALKAQKKHEDNLRKLEIEALTRQRRMVATAAVALMLEANNSIENIEDYKERIKDLHNTLSQAAKRGQGIIVKKTKEDLKIFMEERKREEELKKQAEERLDDTKNTLMEVDMKLAIHGVNMESIEDLYSQKLCEQQSEDFQEPMSLSSLTNI